MTIQHPITPPLELVGQWSETWIDAKVKHDGLIDFIATQAAQWGSDQELEECCAEVLWQEGSALAAKLRDRRRPKPPSLKEQALEALKVIECEYVIGVSTETIRRALEALPE
jgi:hypothetical protein